MASAVEGAGAKQALAAALAQGVETLSAQGEVTFSKYVRLVLPLDGYVFWVKATLVSQTAMLNMAELNAAQFNQTQVEIETPGPFAIGLSPMGGAAIGGPPASGPSTPTITVKGSFHYSTNQNQAEAESEAVNTVIFTAEAPVQLFNDMQDSVLWIAEYGGDIEGFDGPITFAFSSRGRYYEQADLFHYAGTAVLPAFKAQLINSLDQLAGRGLIVSNSLPVWLSLSGYTPPYDNGINCSLPLYPSFLIPDNLAPPYGAVHVFPEETEALQSAPLFGPVLDQWSLSKDRVRVTLYGLDNEAALSFLAAVLQYSYDYNTIGIMDMPGAIRDEKRVAAELNVLAQKKSIEFTVSYQQNVIRDVARQMIKKIIPNYYPQTSFPYVIPPYGALTLADLADLLGIDLYLNGKVIMVPDGSDLPTSNVGLGAGVPWDNGGVLMLSTAGTSGSSPPWLARVNTAISAFPGIVFTDGLVFEVS